jgi:hypothetical protein
MDGGKRRKKWKRKKLSQARHSLPTLPVVFFVSVRLTIRPLLDNRIVVQPVLLASARGFSATKLFYCRDG